MNVLIKTATALGFILAIPLFALPAYDDRGRGRA